MHSDESLDHLDSKMLSRHGSGSRGYIDVDGDEYAVNSHEIHHGLDKGHDIGHHSRGGMDFYDIFKDFDRDGDGIVDDIDFDDPHWTESCKKNGYDPLEMWDDSSIHQGRYRGLTDEEW